MKRFDHVFLVGFGAPSKAADLDPYLDRFASRLRIPRERLGEVKKHYEQIGGYSPYNAAVEDFRARLEKALYATGLKLPVFAGMRHWHPFVEETLVAVREKGLTNGIAIALAPHRSPASFEVYAEALATATGGQGVYDFLGPWHEEPEFVEAWTDTAREALERQALKPARLVFCAHSIPSEAAEKSRYREEIEAGARAVAREASGGVPLVAYHSQSARAGVPWIGPTPAEAFDAAAQSGAKSVVVVPIGFLCENAEILYDLDIAARREAQARGLEFVRAHTVLSDARIARLFVRLIGDLHGNP